MLKGGRKSIGRKEGRTENIRKKKKKETLLVWKEETEKKNHWYAKRKKEKEGGRKRYTRKKERKRERLLVYCKEEGIKKVLEGRKNIQEVIKRKIVGVLDGGKLERKEEKMFENERRKNGSQEKRKIIGMQAGRNQGRKEEKTF